MGKILSIEKGWGQSSIFFTTNPKCVDEVRVDEIKEEQKQINSDELYISVYRGYKNGRIVFEMAAGIDITVVYNP